MAKSKKDNNDNDDVIWQNLKGFCQKGAKPSNYGNVPTGHFKLDFAIQYGMDASKVDLSRINGYDPSKTLGIPLGYLVEIFGEEGGGKSSLAYRIAGYAQKLKYPVAWIDCEHSFQENLAKINGCDSNQLIYSNLINHSDPDKDYYAEDVMDNIIMLMKSGVKVIILDSVANLVPKTLFEADADKQFMGLLARLLSANLGKIVGHAEKNGALVIFINQLREKIGQLFGNPETSPGGHSLRHNASLRIKISKKKSKDADIFVPDPETGDNILIGRHALVRIEKNRFAKPFFESLEVPIYYEPYFPDIEEIVFDTARQIKLISIRNLVYNWDGLKIQGRKEFIDHIKKENLLPQLIASVKEKALENNIILPPEIIQYSQKIKKNDEQLD